MSKTITKEITLRENGELRVERITVPVSEPSPVVPIARINPVYRAAYEKWALGHLPTFGDRLDPKKMESRSISDALGPTRLSYSWATYPDLNDELRSSGELLIDRARSLERTSDYVRRFLALAESNVVGADGFRLQVKARKPDVGRNYTLLMEHYVVCSCAVDVVLEYPQILDYACMEPRGTVIELLC